MSLLVRDSSSTLACSSALTRLQLLVQGLHLFLGGGEFLVGGLQFFVGGLQFLVGGPEFLLRGLHLFAGGLRLVADLQEFLLQFRQPRVARRASFADSCRRLGASGAATSVKTTITSPSQRLRLRRAAGR